MMMSTFRQKKSGFFSGFLLNRSTSPNLPRKASEMSDPDSKSYEALAQAAVRVNVFRGLESSLYGNYPPQDLPK